MLAVAVERLFLNWLELHQETIFWCRNRYQHYSDFKTRKKFNICKRKLAKLFSEYGWKVFGPQGENFVFIAIKK